MHRHQVVADVLLQMELLQHRRVKMKVNNAADDPLATSSTRRSSGLSGRVASCRLLVSRSTLRWRHEWTRAETKWTRAETNHLSALRSNEVTAT
jgi:hypothetical protein